MSRGIKVSIIIPVLNKLNFTKKCIEKIFKLGSKYKFEVIVVNNGSNDGTREYLSSKKEVKKIHNYENLGFAKACNQGANAAKGEYLLFLNNDTEPTEGWLDILVEELDQNPNVAVVGSKLLFPDDTIQHAGVVFGDNKLPHHLYYRDFKDKPYVNKKREFKAVTGACLMIRGKIFFEVGRFDDTYINGLEDMDLCLKVGKKGKKIVYCPQSILYHFESVTEGRDKKINENRKIFLQRWSSQMEPDYKKYLVEDNTIGEMEKLSYLLEVKNKEIRNLKKIITQKDRNFQGKSKKITIYTAIFGDKDTINEPKLKIDGCDFVCFTDNPYLKSKIFDIRVVPAIHFDPTRNARMHKILAHRFLPEYEYTVWIDGNIIVNADFEYIRGIIDKYLKDVNLAMFIHPDRDCIYKEADACIQLKKDNSNLIKKQMEKYREEGYPENNGLIMSSVVFRRNLAEDVVKVNEDWWKEITCFSRRDQLSFNYVAWKNSFKYSVIPGNAYNDEHFTRIKHKIGGSVSGFDEIIKLKNEEIYQLSKELRIVKKSIFWKIRSLYIKTKSVLLHPLKSSAKALHVAKRDGIINLFRYLLRRIKRTLTD